MIRLVSSSGVVPAPWKNGGGTQRELFRSPDGEEWSVRVSLADIDRDGAFSHFPGISRHFAIVAGRGARLTVAGATHAVTGATPALAFDGGMPCHCALIDGPTRALNLMLRGTEGRLERVGDDSAPSETRGLYADGAGRLSADVSGAAVTHDVPAGSLAWFEGAAHSARFTSTGWWLIVEGTA